MCSKKSYKHGIHSEFNFYYQSESASEYIKDNPVVSRNTCLGKIISDIIKGFPLRFFDLIMPCS